MRLAAIVCSVLCAILIGAAAAAPVAGAASSAATKHCPKRHHGKHRRCKKRRKRHHASHTSPPTTVPGTPPAGESTTSPPDADKDGIVDVVVTAVAASGQEVFVEIPEGEVGFTERNYSGLMIDTSALGPSELPHVGDSVQIEGFVAETPVAPALEAESIVVTATGKALTPWTVTLAEIEKGQPTGPALNGLLVRVAGLKLTATGAHTWTVTEPSAPDSELTVGDTVIGTLPGDSEGQEYTEIVGIAQPPGLSQLLPRTLGDIVET